MNFGVTVVRKQSEIAVYRLVIDGELQIDSDGCIWRLKKRTYDRWTGGTRVTPCQRTRAEIGRTGWYLQVRAMIDGKRHCAAAHRLVWMHFNGLIPQGITINHKDGLKQNNRPSNLELATYSEQRHHAIKILGARHHDVRGSKHPKTSLTEESVLKIRQRRAAGEMVKAIALDYGITPNAASAICRGTTWKHVRIYLPG